MLFCKIWRWWIYVHVFNHLLRRLTLLSDMVFRCRTWNFTVLTIVLTFLPEYVFTWYQCFPDVQELALMRYSVLEFVIPGRCTWTSHVVCIGFFSGQGKRREGGLTELSKHEKRSHLLFGSCKKPAVAVNQMYRTWTHRYDGQICHFRHENLYDNAIESTCPSRS